MKSSTPKSHWAQPMTIRVPPEDIAGKQDPKYSKADFERDLGKLTKRLAKPSKPGRGSPKQ